MALSRDGADPTLVLDAGTGLQRLSRHLEGRPFRGTILVGHLHWDHTHGIPFFAAGDNPDARVTLALPDEGDPEKLLERFMSPPSFPITPRQLRGDWSFVRLAPGEHSIEGFGVLALDIPHKGGRTYGFRVTDGTSTVAYLSDHSPVVHGGGPDGFGEYHENALGLARGVDVLIHDAQHTAEEFAGKRDWGHSAVDYAVGLAEAAGAKRVVLFHHDPPRTDDDLDAIVAGYAGGSVEVSAAAEGVELEL